MSLASASGSDCPANTRWLVIATLRVVRGPRATPVGRRGRRLPSAPFGGSAMFAAALATAGTSLTIFTSCTATLLSAAPASSATPSW